jgi:hypothetical protein
MANTIFKARVWEKVVVTGTGTITLSGISNLGPWRTVLNAGYVTGNIIPYCIADNTANTWETGFGVFSSTPSPGTLTRVAIESSNNNNPIVFAGNTCDVTVEILSPSQTTLGVNSAGILPAFNINGLIDNTLLGGIPRLALPAAVSNIITLPFVGNLDVCYEGTISATTSFNITGGNIAIYQSIILAFTENSTGNFAVTLPASPTVKWPGGMQPTPVITPNARNVYRFTTTGVAGAYDGNY